MSSIVNGVRDNILIRRVIGFVWHLLGFLLCWWLSFLIRFDFSIEAEFRDSLRETIGIVVAVFLLCILAFRLYQGLWRFFTFRDCLITGIAFGTGTLLTAGGIYLFRGFSFEGFPRSVLVINFLLILGWEIGGRGFVRLYREWRLSRRADEHPAGKRVLVVGDPEESDGLIRSLSRQGNSVGKVVAIIADGSRHRGGRLHGIRVYGELDRVGRLVKEHDVETMIFLPPYTGPNRVRQIIDSVAAEQASCEYRVVPSIDDIAAGRVDVEQIRKVEIEDLLNREPYEIDLDRLREFVNGKRLMVTGAGGSIGSEICRQVLSLKPKSLVLFEISEFLLFEVERELRLSGTDTEIFAVTGDVKKTEHIRKAIATSRGVDIIYHAAAYKHVDLMERNPFACVENNVIGTAVLAEVAEERGVSQFVLISSDKAVRPTSLMGASKRLAERCLIERPHKGTQFKAVRFGNVLGSSGSVVPIFKSQIAEGGPVTVTSPEVTRFFMTIPEAVELVLAAGAIGDDRRVFVLEMGQPVKIDNLARKMIVLSGFVPDVDISIAYTGLKPGEKEYEELLTDDEGVMRTDADRIWVVARKDGTAEEVVDLGYLLELVDAEDEQKLREYVHSLIPGSRLLE